MKNLTFSIIALLSFTGCDFVFPPPVLVTIALDQEAYLTNEMITCKALLHDSRSGGGPYTYTWETSDGRSFRGPEIELSFPEANDPELTLTVSNIGGKDSYTRVMPIQQSGSITFFTRTERVRTTININGEIRRLEYNITPNSNVICGTDTLNIATVNNLPLGTLRYYVTRSGQTRERTIEIDEACQLVEL